MTDHEIKEIIDRHNRKRVKRREAKLEYTLDFGEFVLQFDFSLN